MPDPKGVLLARVATARAELWCELLGLSEDTLANQPMAGEWTAKDMLAHIAAWDDMHAGRVQAILAGRSADIQTSQDRDALNETVFQERRAWSLEDAVAATLAARANFLALVDPLPWEEIVRERPAPGGRPQSVFFLTRRRAEHEPLHTAEIRAWTAGSGLRAAPGPRNILVAALQSSREALLAWGALIPPRERSSRPVYGQWTWQDVLGHVADWEAWYVRGVRDMLAGQPGGADFDGDEERWNESHAAARKGEPFEKTQADFATTRAGLLALLDEFDQERLAVACKTPFQSMRTFYVWFAGAAQHEVEHAQGLAGTLGGE